MSDGQLPEHHVQTQFLIREFKTESDRAAAILAAAMIDEALKTAICLRLVEPTRKANDPLFDEPNAPLGHFSAKIEAGFRIGLYDRHTRDAIHAVRRIRNRFAHDVTGCRFSEPDVADAVRSLASARGIPARSEGNREKHGAGSRGDFLYAASWILFILSRAHPHVVRLEVGAGVAE